MRNDNNTTMSISLTEIMKEYVLERVGEGTYTSISDYVRDLIRVDMEKANKVENVRWLVREGTNALDRGEGRERTPELFEELKASGRAQPE